MYVCVCVYIHIYIYIHMYVCINAQTSLPRYRDTWPTACWYQRALRSQYSPLHTCNVRVIMRGLRTGTVTVTMTSFFARLTYNCGLLSFKHTRVCLCRTTSVCHIELWIDKQKRHVNITVKVMSISWHLCALCTASYTKMTKIQLCKKSSCRLWDRIAPIYLLVRTRTRKKGLNEKGRLKG